MSQELPAIVQAALRQARQHRPRPWLGLLWPRAIIVRPFRGVPRFGALIWLNMLFIDGRLKTAPPPVVTAIIAHEYGHVANGHAAVALAIVVGASLLMGIAPATPANLLQTLAVAALYLGTAVGLIWLHRPARELEADAFGAKVVGQEALISALDWIAVSTGKGWTPLMFRRRAALKSDVD